MGGRRRCPRARAAPAPVGAGYWSEGRRLLGEQECGRLFGVSRSAAASRQALSGTGPPGRIGRAGLGGCFRFGTADDHASVSARPAADSTKTRTAAEDRTPTARGRSQEARVKFECLTEERFYGFCYVHSWEQPKGLA